MFRAAWHWDGDNWTLAHSITPDVIYDKAAVNAETTPAKDALLKHYPMINHPAFSLHAGSKLQVSRAFKEFAKPYFRATSREDLINILAQLPDTLVVAKPERGNSGEGILIAEKAEILERVAFPILVQEFIDSSNGIPGVMKGLHDLRIIYCNESLVYAYYRTPRAGGYLANVAQGGKQTMIAEEDIPNSVWPIVHAVQSHYEKFSPKIYTIDLMFDPTGRPWIVELNTMPGLYPDESERPHIGRLYQAIIGALKFAVQKK
jgi:glutathione synthase/RimK-type ligase-like ATP-grasp enzyme